MALEYKNRLQRWLKEVVTVTPQLLFEYSDIYALSVWIYQEINIDNSKQATVECNSK